mgnify:CR=1 FL=1
MLKIRLKKYGRKSQPSYRIVAIESSVKRDGKSVEELGFYNPIKKQVFLKKDRILYFLKRGAQPTDTVKNIFIKAKIL